MYTERCGAGSRAVSHTLRPALTLPPPSFSLAYRTAHGANGDVYPSTDPTSPPADHDDASEAKSDGERRSV